MAALLPETLDHIFTYLPKPSQLSCAMTCHAWTSSALDELWREMYSIFPFLQLISPMGSAGENGLTRWTLSSPLSQTDWSRFRTYAQRTRKLTFRSTDEWLGKPNSFFDESSVKAALYAHPFGHSLLPALDVIEWHSSTLRSSIALFAFIPKTLRRFSLSLVGLDASNLSEILPLFGHRLPSVQYFQLALHDATETTASLVSKLLCTIPQVSTVELPYFLYTPDVVTSLRQLPLLHTLSSITSHRVASDVAHLDFLEDLPTAGRYQSLRDLNIETSRNLVPALKAAAESLEDLRQLTLSCRSFNTSKNTFRLFSIVAAHLSNLEHLHLNLSKVDRDPHNSDPLNFDQLQILFALHDLKSLQLGHEQPMTLSEEHVRHMALNWEHLDILKLCSDPYRHALTDDGGNQFDILYAFAEMFPDLNELGLFFDYDSSPNITWMSGSERGFRRLHSLDVGYSRLREENIQVVGVFLGGLCPPWMSVVHDETAPDLVTLSADDAQAQDRWHSVTSLANLISSPLAALRTQAGNQRPIAHV